MSKMTIFWFRRDLRLEDNRGLERALSASDSVQPLFIFDRDILDPLQDRDDARVTFLHQTLTALQGRLREEGSGIWVEQGRPLEVWRRLLKEHLIEAVYANEDGEPSALARDRAVGDLLASQGVPLRMIQDQTLFAPDEILTSTGTPYTVYTPFRRKATQALKASPPRVAESAKRLSSLRRGRAEKMPSLAELGFRASSLSFPTAKPSASIIKTYDRTRDDLALLKGTTHLGLHFRFGTIGIRGAAKFALRENDTWLSELLWREFFMHILRAFPHVVERSFRPAYDQIEWRSSKRDFERWCAGETGYPIVDAGLRELNATGYMHNRARMIAASFLTKHLLIHWLEGERYFARKLLDYDLAANNGNWQWVAGSGCDAAPYFRIFNPIAQGKKFDPKGEYVRRWVPEADAAKTPSPIIDLDEGRGRALAAYTKALKGKRS